MQVYALIGLSGNIGDLFYTCYDFTAYIGSLIQTSNPECALVTMHTRHVSWMCCRLLIASTIKHTSLIHHLLSKIIVLSIVHLLTTSVIRPTVKDTTERIL